MPRAHIPSILTAAGTTVAYADVWAAYVLYEFLSPGAAFVLLGLVALATLGAALVHGPALGGLGLVGAYVTPLLVSTTQPSYWALYVYLAVVTAAAYALARFRMWRWLAITAAGLLDRLAVRRHGRSAPRIAVGARLLGAGGLRTGGGVPGGRTVLRPAAKRAARSSRSPRAFSPATSLPPLRWCLRPPTPTSR